MNNDFGMYPILNNNMNMMNNMNNMNNMNMMNNMNNMNKMNMMNNMNLNNNANNIPNINNQPPQAEQSNAGNQTFLQVKFKYFGDSRFPSGVDFFVHGRGDMTIQQLIKNFRTKLSDDSVNIRSYLLNGSINLDPDSLCTVNQMGITQNSIINATKQ